ncbi:DmsC/YnfH family molybdoenzyme membrane anchor subunit [Telmatospirillum sp.]|uniref:dimethyl sulfoxide reductase anchor subunit family protein n=1 Tax=Telmatospirillum sp. TaxID=2079197 RepID=UPI00283D895D|nr:DmsC/YnfH family molybdoenzyme membrane anchor subunit [Telmatospirillum sp.]MDR3438714.1 dimethyl sulfoxide reductase anchor subunit [Telmatospirillum sp.]
MTPSFELPLVIFTILSQQAIGLTLLYALRTAGRSARPEPSARIQWLASAGILALGLVVSLTHLGHPEGAPRAVIHLSTAWLSREALLFGLLVALMAVTGFLGAVRALVIAAAAAGLVALFVQGMVYAPPSFPAVNNALPFAFFLVTAIILGAGTASWFAPQDRQPFLRRILVGALVAGLLLFLISPCIWLSGGAIMRLTAVAYFASTLYWAHIGVGLILPLLVVLAVRRIPVWLPVLLLAGALCGRLVFYVDTVHSAVNLGGVY